MMNLSRILAALSFLASGCDGASGPVTLSGSTMGTGYHVKLSRLPDGTGRDALQAAVDGALEEVNDQMSTYRPDSEISRFNRAPEAAWFSVSPATVRVVREAIRMSERSEGAFDVTVSPLVDAWGFGAGSKKATEVPTESDLERARSLVGYRWLEARDTPPALKKLRAGVQVDLSAIAKGHGVDVVCDLLDDRGVEAYMVEIGGEVRTRGEKAESNPWVIGIETPTDGRRGVQETIALQDGALATSGDYRQYFEEDGKRYSHTIDPRTGRPVEHRLASVSVVARNCMTADALATTFLVLGPVKAYEYAQREGLAALLLIRSEDGFVRQATPEFDELVRER